MVGERRNGFLTEILLLEVLEESVRRGTVRMRRKMAVLSMVWTRVRVVIEKGRLSQGLRSMNRVRGRFHRRFFEGLIATDGTLAAVHAAGPQSIALVP